VVTRGETPRSLGGGIVTVPWEAVVSGGAKLWP
jgi:hypothetical protein